MNKTATIILALAISTTILGVNSVMAEEGKIQPWIKTVFTYYGQGDITDTELLDTLRFLIDEGILKVDEKTYDPFSLEKFPNTGGFNPEWLEGEKELILESCVEAQSMGYDNDYCQYVQ